MKKQLLISLMIILFASGTLFAQTEQGKWLIGATSNMDFIVTSSDASDDNITSFNLGGQTGYFFIDNLNIGARMDFSTTSFGDFSSSTFSIGPGVRYYVNGTFFVGGLFSFVTGSSDDGDFESDFNFTQFGLEAGYPIWIVENVAIEPALIYSSASGDDIDNSNGFGLNVGFNLYF